MRVSDGKSCGDGDAKRDDVAEAPGMLSVERGSAPSDNGRAVKNSLAMRARVSVSGNPAGIANSVPGRLVDRSESRFSGAPFCGSLVVMVAADFDVFERGDRVIDQNCGRAVERD